MAYPDGIPGGHSLRSPTLVGGDGQDSCRRLTDGGIVTRHLADGGDQHVQGPLMRYFVRLPHVLMVLVVVTATATRADNPSSVKKPSDVKKASATPGASPAVDEQIAKLLQSDPAGFLELCLREGLSRVRNFRCTFLMNTRIDGKLSGVQTIDALYRQKPRSVYFRWRDNSGGAKRMLWVKGRDLEPDGGETVRVQPDGALGYIAHNVKLAVSDPRIREKERQPITSFGPDATLAQIVKDNRAAQAAKRLKLTYHGTASIDGRSTYVLIRELPGRYPANGYSDARMVLHIDQQYLVPLSIESYLDPAGKELLESDVFTKVQFNLEFTPQDFEF